MLILIAIVMILAGLVMFLAPKVIVQIKYQTLGVLASVFGSSVTKIVRPGLKIVGWPWEQIIEIIEMTTIQKDFNNILVLCQMDPHHFEREPSHQQASAQTPAPVGLTIPTISVSYELDFQEQANSTEKTIKLYESYNRLCPKDANGKRNLAGMDEMVKDKVQGIIQSTFTQLSVFDALRLKYDKEAVIQEINSVFESTNVPIKITFLIINHPPKINDPQLAKEIEIVSLAPIRLKAQENEMDLKISYEDRREKLETLKANNNLTEIRKRLELFGFNSLSDKEKNELYQFMQNIEVAKKMAENTGNIYYINPDLLKMLETFFPKR